MQEFSKHNLVITSPIEVANAGLLLISELSSSNEMLTYQDFELRSLALQTSFPRFCGTLFLTRFSTDPIWLPYLQNADGHPLSGGIGKDLPVLLGQHFA